MTMTRRSLFASLSAVPFVAPALAVIHPKSKPEPLIGVAMRFRFWRQYDTQMGQFTTRIQVDFEPPTKALYPCRIAG